MSDYLILDGDYLILDGERLALLTFPPVAGFNAPVTVVQGEVLEIENTSAFALSYVWKIGGTVISNDEVPKIPTDVLGSFDLSLTAINDEESDEYLQTIKVVAESVPPSSIVDLSVSAILGVSSSPATDNEGVTGYITQRKGNSGAWANLASDQLIFNDREDLPDYPANLSYRRKAKDAAGNVSVNWSNVVTVAYQPLKAVINVSGNSGTVTVSATLSGTIAPAGARFAVDGAPIGTEDLTEPYSVAFDTTTLENGGHTFGVLARDAENYTELATTLVNIQNAIAPIGGVFIYDEIRLPFYHGDPEEVWSAITRTHEYEDAGDSSNELSDTPPIEWQLIYNGLSPQEAAEFDAHFSTYRLSRTFTFLDKWGNENQNVKYKEYRKSHEGNKSWIKTREIIFVKKP